MEEWFEDISQGSLEEVMRSQVNNTAWGKELRLSNKAVVVSRLAHEISPEEYAASRQLNKQDMVEFGRRRKILVDAIWTRLRSTVQPARVLRPSLQVVSVEPATPARLKLAPEGGGVKAPIGSGGVSEIKQ